MATKSDKIILGESMKVEVAFPACVHIELVQANDLRHYEIFLWLISFAASTASGFWVSFASMPFNKVLLASSVAFSMLTLIFTGVAYYYRSKIRDMKLKKILLLENFNNQ
jgi:hypothetical protein